MDNDIKDYLISLGFDDEEVQEILVFANNDIDNKELKKKVEYLSSIGCSPRIIRIVIEENPLFMTTELSDVISMVEYLKSLGLQEDLIEILEIEPDILSTSLETVKRNLGMLKMLMNNELLDTLYKDRMEIFTFNPDYLSDKLTYLISNGLKDKIYDIIMCNIEIFEKENDEIDIENLKK